MPANIDQFSSVAQLWTAAHQASLSITNCQSLLKLTSIESVMPSNHLILCHPLLLPPSIFPSTRVFSNKSGLHIKWIQVYTYVYLPAKIRVSSTSYTFSTYCFFMMDWALFCDLRQVWLGELLMCAWEIYIFSSVEHRVLYMATTSSMLLNF